MWTSSTWKAVEALARAAHDNAALAERLVRRALPDGSEFYLLERGGEVVERAAGSDAVQVIASDESVDRYGDIINAGGWDLKAYRKNPVVLTDHDYRVISIVGTGKPTIDRAAKRLLVDVTLDSSDDNERARLVRGLLNTRSLRAVSVGFIPLDWEEILDDDGKWTGGFRFKKSELLELSFVAVGANRNALATSMSETDPDAEELAERVATQISAARVAAQVREIGR